MLDEVPSVVPDEDGSPEVVGDKLEVIEIEVYQKEVLIDIDLAILGSEGLVIDNGLVPVQTNPSAIIEMVVDHFAIPVKVRVGV